MTVVDGTTEEPADVVFVSQTFPPEQAGGASRVHDTATNLAAQGWNVTVLTPPPCFSRTDFERSWHRKSTRTVDGVTVHELWSWQPLDRDPGLRSRLPYYLCFAVHALVWLLSNYRRYDVVVTSTPPISTGIGGFGASIAGKPWVVDVRDLWIDNAVSLGYVEPGSFVERASRRLQRTVLHTADLLTVTTDSLGRSVSDRYGDRLREKTVVIPNGVDTTVFEPEARSPDGGRSIDDGPTVVYTGNLGRAQDLESVVEAMDHLPRDDVTLKLVGSGDAEAELQRLARELGLEDVVEFHGVVPREQVPNLLDRATLGVAPIHDAEELRYAVPTKVYEYMACQLPAVVTGQGEIRRFVEESGGGIHVANEPERIADRIAALLADDRRRAELARNGYEHVVEHYDRGRIASRLSDELQRLIRPTR